MVVKKKKQKGGLLETLDQLLSNKLYEYFEFIKEMINIYLDTEKQLQRTPNFYYNIIIEIIGKIIN